MKIQRQVANEDRGSIPVRQSDGLVLPAPSFSKETLSLIENGFDRIRSHFHES